MILEFIRDTLYVRTREILNIHLYNLDVNN